MEVGGRQWPGIKPERIFADTRTTNHDNTPPTWLLLESKNTQPQKIFL
jgi:hypothetical protein